MGNLSTIIRQVFHKVPLKNQAGSVGVEMCDLSAINSL